MGVFNDYSIELYNVNKSFGNVKVLENISLKVREGDFVAIAGYSGSGKSTLLRMLAGLDRPTRGVIKIEGRELRGTASQVKYVFQENRLLPWKSVLNNVILGEADRDVSKALQALEKVGMLSRKSDKPGILSQGQKIKVALARAFAGNPKVLLLDEPFLELDILSRLELEDIIEKLWLEQGFTVLLATHDVREAVRLASRILVVNNKNITMDVQNTLVRPRQKNEDSYYFEQSYLLEHF